VDSLLHSIVLSPEDGVGELERRVAKDLETLNLPAANWPARVFSPSGDAVTDVVVVGAGMNGIAAAAALIFKGVRNVRILDRASAGNEGPWLTFARMDTLRSPKTLPGPALGIPSLSFRAWYDAAFGSDAWEALYKIENAVWVDYLRWLQRVLSLPVEHQVEVTSITPSDGLLKVATASPRGTNVFYARRVVLATGRGGAGGDKIPNFIDADLRPDLAAHTNEAIDFAQLAGRSIGIVGGGASAWDNAATALERGAGRVDMYVRRHHLPQINKGRGSASPGYFHGWSALDDAARWALFVYLNDVQAPPPHETVRRALRQTAFHIHFGKPVQRATRLGDKAAVQIRDESELRSHDFLIVGTGFHVDAASIPEIAGLAPMAARWRDRYDPPEDLRRPELGDFPYLGDGFELLEREPGRCPGLSKIHLVNHGAALSQGAIASDIPGVNVAAERVSTAIVKSLFAEDISAIRQALEAFDEPELQDTPFFVPR
jgi:cation diffusion facilitator CzcD-associated flavoprotein CzcO